jgi:2'-5' RNA ligase
VTTILTLELQEPHQSYFESLRREHYPAHLNQVPAHMTLFHQLPLEAVPVVHRATHRPPFSIRVTGLRSLGRGVAYRLASAELQALHGELAREFEPYLIPQDRQPFRPHIVVQNKATPEQARVLLAQLEAGFQPVEAVAAGLTVWNYLGGPWERVHFFPFR